MRAILEHLSLWDEPRPPPGLPEDLRVAAPERAVLELLYEAGVKQSLEEARNLFDGLRSPRKDLLGQLLSCCTSVKAVRLFLTWARETSLVDVDALLEQYRGQLNFHGGLSTQRTLPYGSVEDVRSHVPRL